MNYGRVNLLSFNSELQISGQGRQDQEEEGQEKEEEEEKEEEAIRVFQQQV